ncbi:hypothetical protein CANCADRAFT_122675 [Tortispora caseinolytica NRRL Y-17796]|uniref:Acid phosphatase n=1 Tax=Tortispora caseinolytica NRRL Y-17796 TaxID=767744 RepID=A0A1E4THU7_9ASCO|nr:hypothetical protein CANCADRAFT_122675 [Tortispora caseinolytica NRRL Y-17796]
MKLTDWTVILGAPVASAKIIGAVVYGRHGDRTPKAMGSPELTILGRNQMFSAGDYHHNRYISNSSDYYLDGIDATENLTQYMSATNIGGSAVLFDSATTFNQALFPKVADESITLVNGSEYSDPMDGIQYVSLFAAAPGSSDFVYLDGNNDCPAWTTASKSYLQSESFKATNASTAEFYAGFKDLIQSLNPKTSVKYNYGGAYDVFDILNYGMNHIASVADQVTEEEYFQLRTLADTYSWNLIYNESQPLRGIAGRTMLAQIQDQISAIAANSGSNRKLAFIAGSYDTIQSGWFLMNIPQKNPGFYAIPDYAATMVFEVHESDSGDLTVQFGYRNTTLGEGAEYEMIPVFDFDSVDMDYTTFMNKMNDVTLNDISEWCTQCDAWSLDICASTKTLQDTQAQLSALQTSTDDELSAAAGGGIGAGVTIGVFAIAGVLFYLFRRNKKSAALSKETLPVVERAMSESTKGSTLG